MGRCRVRGEEKKKKIIIIRDLGVSLDDHGAQYRVDSDEKDKRPFSPVLLLVNVILGDDCMRSLDV